MMFEDGARMCMLLYYLRNMQFYMNTVDEKREEGSKEKQNKINFVTSG